MDCIQATAVIPGSHLWGAERMPKVEECTYAEMEPGSALFTLGCKSTPTKAILLQPTLAMTDSFSNLSRRGGEQMRQDRPVGSPHALCRLWV